MIYILNSTLQTWHEARASCEALGMQLATVHFAAELAQFNLIGELADTWIGATDAAVEGTFVYPDTNTSVSTVIAPWAASQPDNAGAGEHCLSRNSNGEWVDKSCGDQSRAVCSAARCNAGVR